ncbi:Na(+)/H(+) antiporter subunit F1 [Virgibacillus siamensis]|uniref:Na(+)/H(+) antiporter subunit F1 n=1 Tax=Virgibacillus siamensis TaxID=480071 RepID=UPI0009845022|nr:Na(+)/H(+) antiporter subunit F1 [Virgibacillus siamensis]
MNDILKLTDSLLEVVTALSIILIAVSLILLLIRIIQGPTNADRAVALDAIGINLVGLAALLSIILVTTKFNDVVLLIGILLFIGTLVIAKYLEKGVIIDRHTD